MRLTPLLLLTLALSPAAFAQFPNTCTTGTPNFSDKAAPTKNDIDLKGGCTLQGIAPAAFTPAEKSAEEAQNRAKNNFCAQGTAAPIAIKDMLNLQNQVTAQKLVTPEKPPADRSGLTKLGEGKPVQFTGFVFEARQEGAESVNCKAASTPNSAAWHDIHISLIDHKRTSDLTDKSAQGKLKSEQEECGGFVAEMSPHHRIAAWTAENVMAVANLGLRVRVTGQRFFDGSHLPCSNGKADGDNPKRVSLWEIHPIYAFEVCPSGTCAATGWQSLEEFCSTSGKCKAEGKKK
jgi:hypothetical protein